MPPKAKRRAKSPWLSTSKKRGTKRQKKAADKKWLWEEIRDSRLVDGRQQVLVKWVGFETATWEPVTNFSTQVIADYNQQRAILRHATGPPAAPRQQADPAPLAGDAGQAIRVDEAAGAADKEETETENKVRDASLVDTDCLESLTNEDCSEALLLLSQEMILPLLLTAATSAEVDSAVTSSSHYMDDEDKHMDAEDESDEQMAKDKTVIAVAPLDLQLDMQAVTASSHSPTRLQQVMPLSPSPTVTLAPHVPTVSSMLMICYDPVAVSSVKDETLEKKAAVEEQVLLAHDHDDTNDWVMVDSQELQQQELQQQELQQQELQQQELQQVLNVVDSAMVKSSSSASVRETAKPKQPRASKERRRSTSRRPRRMSKERHQSASKERRGRRASATRSSTSGFTLEDFRKTVGCAWTYYEVRCPQGSRCFFNHGNREKQFQDPRPGYPMYPNVDPCERARLSVRWEMKRLNRHHRTLPWFPVPLMPMRPPMTLLRPRPAPRSRSRSYTRSGTRSPTPRRSPRPRRARRASPSSSLSRRRSPSPARRRPHSPTRRPRPRSPVYRHSQHQRQYSSSHSRSDSRAAAPTAAAPPLSSQPPNRLPMPNVPMPYDTTPTSLLSLEEATTEEHVRELAEVASRWQNYTRPARESANAASAALGRAGDALSTWMPGTTSVVSPTGGAPTLSSSSELAMGFAQPRWTADEGTARTEILKLGQLDQLDQSAVSMRHAPIAFRLSARSGSLNKPARPMGFL